ncbi:cytochrome-c peroxidase [Maribacter sp. HTCC2170]|uniref:cytochrome-c peroxidase n=1 Tax=Maribacter sp. (strain HTCC2170 / KCCM 42371) TaxID=313603 RepID=UPI00006BD541|nr:cytochrome c peroxidase [Maribacter sp. HTCC2170]EAR02052.1 di-haem cytochrome c peroxidase [Maribacter sp. HTCC2170]
MRSLLLFILLFVSVFSLLGCSDSKTKKISNKPVKKVSTTISALPKQVMDPKGNVNSFEKIELGRLLFFDPILSGNKDVACATCHHPSTGYAEFLDISIGANAKGFGSKRKFNSPNDIPFVKRNAQTIINTAFNGINTYNKYNPGDAPMFWDDRVKSLEKQALEPIKAFEEMRGHGFSESEILEEVVSRLNQIPEYRELFNTAFGDANISIENLGKAIAAFERSLITNNSRFDQFMRGDNDAILISEKEGFELFKKVGCVNCHNGPMFSDYKVHVLGVPQNSKLELPDAGVKDSFGFRTPSLRNLRYTAPYMHNGSLKTLKRVLEFYEDIANGKSRNPLVPKEKFDPFVRELELSVKEMSLIISFLNTLNDDDFDKSIPEKVPSGLSVGGNIH